MKKIKKITAFVLAAFLLLTSGNIPVLASSIVENSVEVRESAKGFITEEKAKKTVARLNSLMVDVPMVATPGTQRIVASVGKDGSKLDSSVLVYRNIGTKKTYKVNASNLKDNFAVFTMEYPDESWTGTYALDSITYTMNGVTTTTTFKEMGMNPVFGVNQEANTNPDDVFEGEDTGEQTTSAGDVSMNIVAMDSNGKAAGADIQDVLSKAEGKMSGLRKGASKDDVDATGLKSVVVVLDPGHGGSDSGAVGNNIVEKNVNLKIGLYCKEELEKYSGVKVYMTRSTDVYVSLADRVNFAAGKKADVFVSLHNNSNVSAVPNGAEVYYPNSNYNPACGAKGAELARIIESLLTDLGIASKGIHVRNTENNSQYPDGSASDYYAVIRQSKLYGIPGIIVEHAFISNASDAANFLSTDEKLKNLGVADAKGIAQYFKLTQGLGFTDIESKSSTSLELQWSAQAGVSGYEIQRSDSGTDNFVTVAKIENASTTNWTDVDLKPGKTYYYRIRTYTISGSKTTKSGFSTVQSGTTMQVPVIASIKSENNKQLKISWNRVENAVSYEVYRSTTADGTYEIIQTVNGIDNCTYDDKKVKEGVEYFYKIRVAGMIDNASTYSDYSAALSGRTAPKPKNVNAKGKESKRIRVYWKGSPNVAGYMITRSTSKNGSYKRIATIKDPLATYYDDTTVSVGKTYYYKVEAYNYNNGVKGYSKKSDSYSTKTVKNTSITSIEMVSTSKLKVVWKKTSGASGYVVYRSTAKDSGFKKVKTITSANTTSFTDSGLTAGTMYYYKIRTTNKVNNKTGYGADSTVRSTMLIKRASISKVEGVNATSIKISWQPVVGASDYEIYRSTSENGKYSKVGTALGSDTAFTDSKRLMAKVYYYKLKANVKCYKTTGNSGFSKVKSGTSLSTTTMVSAVPNEAGQIVLTWNAVLGAKGYEIYRSATEVDGYQLIKTVAGDSVVSCIDDSAAVGSSNYYKMRVVGRASGKDVFGEYSNVVEGKIIQAPSNITVMSASATQLNISWSQVQGAAGYEIYRSTDPNGTYAIVGAIGSGTVLSYSDATVTEGVTYYYKVLALDAQNHKSVLSSAASGCAVAKISIHTLTWDASKNSTLLSFTKMPGDVTGYELYRSSSENVAVWAKIADTKEVTYVDTDVKQDITYYYRVRAYMGTGGKNTYGVFSDTRSTNASDYRIMGFPGTNAAQMAKMYRASGKAYPGLIYSSKGAPDIETFCNIVSQECEAEGVRPEVIFAQICHETNYLQFGGQVQVSQCNFGGLGATDDGARGGVFTDVRTGIRTQVQHMKAYASTEPLKQQCIDSKYAYIQRGKAEYVQQLGGGNWATDKTYAVKMMNYINKIKNA